MWQQIQIRSNLWTTKRNVSRNSLSTNAFSQLQYGHLQPK